jgi:hypothetical protein
MKAIAPPDSLGGPSVTCSKGSGLAMPALLTKTSTGPRPASTSATSRVTSSATDTSAATTRHLRPRPVTRAAVSRAASLWLR